jgi:hypothetical protein
MKIPHKHAEVIKAWADGAEIQWYDDSPREHRWKDCPISFIWDVRFQFRVKPEPKPDVVYYGVFDMDGSMSIESCFTKVNDDGDEIKITFDGETGKLKAAEVL